MASLGKRKELFMNKMQAIIFQKHGTPENLEYAFVPRPVPGHGEVLVKVRAVALNHLDLWALMGMRNVAIPLPHVPGCDISGEVIEKGPGVKGIPLGKPVIVAPGVSCGTCSYCKSGWDSLCPKYNILGLQRNGGYAQFAAVPARNIIPVSKKISFEAWAAVPLVYLTAWHMLVTRANLKKGETVLIHAAGSGVGSAGIQIAKYLGAKVITTVGSDKKAQIAKKLGVEHVINYRKTDFPAEIMKITKARGVEVVLEHIGPETFQASLACLAKKGRLVTCGVTSGPTTQLDIRFVFARQLSIIGCYMGGLPELKSVIRLIEKGQLKPVLDEVFPLREARKALERMESRANFGKIILVPPHKD